MKTLFSLSAALVFVLVPQRLDAQGKGSNPKSPPKQTPKLTPDQEARSQKQKDLFELNSLTGLALGKKISTDGLDAKVFQVLNKDKMLVNLSIARTGLHTTLVMIKCPTKGIVDGKFFGNGSLAEVTGSKELTVTDTTTYNTAGGGTKTVFVLEPAPAVAADPKAHPLVGRWKLVDDKGVVSSYLTVTDKGAMRDHAPDSPGTWQVVDGEARVTWADGYRDVLRLKDGKITFFGLGKASTWDAPPQFRLQAVRIPDEIKKK